MIPVLAGVLLFLSFSSLYYFNLSFLAPLYTQYDLFGMDSLPFLQMIYYRHPFPELHPFSKSLYYLAHAVTAVFPVPVEQAARLVLAALGGGNVALAFFTLRSLLRGPGTAALFAAAFGLFFSNLVFFGVPETYLVSASLILVYAFFLARFRDGMTQRRYLLLSALAGAGAANNLPLASLLVPHSYILWRERKSLLRAAVPVVAGTAAAALVFLGINGLLLNHGYFARLLVYREKWASLSHLADIGRWFQVLQAFFLSSVIAPGKDLSDGVYRIGPYFDRFGKFVLLAAYVYCLDRAARHLRRTRDRAVDGLLLWSLAMTLAYVYFGGTRESFLYSSQVLFPVCLVLAKTFEHSRRKFKYSFAAVFLVLAGCNNLFCLYHPCAVEQLIPRRTVTGNAVVGSRVRESREAAGLTVEQLAARTGIDRETLLAGEKGKIELEAYELDQIARALQRPLRSLCAE